MSYDKANNKVVFNVAVSKGKYFAVGFGTSMKNVDMVIF